MSSLRAEVNNSQSSVHKLISDMVYCFLYYVLQINYF